MHLKYEIILSKEKSKLSNGNLESHRILVLPYFSSPLPQAAAHLVSLQAVIVKLLEDEEGGKNWTLFYLGL